MRYTFPQTLADFEEANRVILRRVAWRRRVIGVVAAVGVAVLAIQSLGTGTQSLRVIARNDLPFVFILGVWVAAFGGLSRRLLVAGSLILSGLLLLMAVLAWRPSATVGGMFLYLLPYLLLVVFSASVPWLTARRFRNNPQLRGDVTYELTPDELRIAREQGSITYRWSGIVRAIETPAFFLFYITKSTAHYLPKHAVPPEDLPDLRAFLRAHVVSGLL